MFRSLKHIASAHDTDKTKIKLHPVSRCIWWAGCGCNDHIVIRPADKPRKGSLERVPAFLCERNSEERSILDLEKEPVQEHFGKYPPATLDIVALTHSAMQDFLTFPALKDVWIDDLDPRPLLHLHNDTGVTLGDMCRALVKQARTSPLNFTDQMLRDYALEVHHEGFRNLFTADFMTSVFPKAEPDMTASWEEFGVALRATATLYKRDPRVRTRNPLHSRIGVVNFNSGDVRPPASELETTFYARFNATSVSNWLDEIEERLDGS